MDAQRVSGSISDDELEDELTMALLEQAGDTLGKESVKLHRYGRKSSPSSSTGLSNESSNQGLIYYTDGDKSDEDDTDKEESSLVGEDLQHESDEDSEFFRKKTSPKKKLPVTRSRAKKTGEDIDGAFKRAKKHVFLDDSDQSDDKQDSDSGPSVSRVKRKKIVVSDDEEEDNQVPTTSNADVKYVQVKKNQTTRDIEREEHERIKRVAEKQAKYNNIIFDEDVDDLDQALNDSFSKQKVAKALVLDQHNGKKVSVHSSLVRHLKPHQLSGVQFLYNCTIESLDRLEHPGGGGILAHCMGLGKTLQTIAFLHTVMTHSIISKTISRVIVVCPKNVVLIWQREFQKWLFENDSTMPEINVFELDSLKTYDARIDLLRTWFNCTMPSVMIVGYEMFRLLTQDYTKPNKKTGKVPANDKKKRKLIELQPEFRRYLQSPGPDLIVCDEGHKLKNIKAEVTITINDIQTRRRLCLTGTPLQNNLGEYFTMVSFVKPGLLGSYDEFKERFELPIKAGQVKDADEFDVRQMRRRCHVLYTKLQGILDRRDFTVLKDALMPKLEYVISLRLSEKQEKLYQLYLETECGDSEDRRRRLFAHYYNFSRIFSHPFQLVIHQEEKEDKAANDLDDFIVDESEDESYDEENERSDKKKKRNDEVETRSETPIGWFEDSGILEENDRHNFALSYKLKFLVEILKECEAIGDKILVFSQSLETLRLIRRMLAAMENDWFKNGHEAILKRKEEKWGWKDKLDYMVITGQVSSKDRDLIQRRFNSQDSARNRLCLISTKAGSLGTNFVAANRVIIFDQNWNPSHDRQALFRAYRFGQTKPVYIYRLVAFGTIEDRIYARQVTKESVSCRVIDENQVKRHYTHADLETLFKLETSEYEPTKPPLYVPPEDQLLACVFSRMNEGVVNCLQHDSLLAHVEDEVLNEEERQQAWDEFNKNINSARQAQIRAQIQTATSNLSQMPNMLMDTSGSQDENESMLFNGDTTQNSNVLDAYGGNDALRAIAQFLESIRAPSDNW